MAGTTTIILPTSPPGGLIDITADGTPADNEKRGRASVMRPLSRMALYIHGVRKQAQCGLGPYDFNNNTEELSVTLYREPFCEFLLVTIWMSTDGDMSGNISVNTEIETIDTPFIVTPDLTVVNAARYHIVVGYGAKEAADQGLVEVMIEVSPDNAVDCKFWSATFQPLSLLPPYSNGLIVQEGSAGFLGEVLGFASAQHLIPLEESADPMLDLIGSADATSTNLTHLEPFSVNGSPFGILTQQSPTSTCSSPHASFTTTYETGDFTAMMWVHTDAVFSSNAVFAKMLSSGTSGFALWYDSNNGRLWSYLKGSGSLDSVFLVELGIKNGSDWLVGLRVDRSGETLESFACEKGGTLTTSATTSTAGQGSIANTENMRFATGVVSGVWLGGSTSFAFLSEHLSDVQLQALADSGD